MVTQQLPAPSARPSTSGMGGLVVPRGGIPHRVGATRSIIDAGPDGPANLRSVAKFQVASQATTADDD